MQRQEFLRIIVSESERLTRLVNQVLDLAKIEAGAAEWHTRPTSTCAPWCRTPSAPPPSSSASAAPS